jgi:DNA-binding MarR family transcriptional regulator
MPQRGIGFSLGRKVHSFSPFWPRWGGHSLKGGTMITAHDINKLTESELRILAHLENYPSKEARFRIYASDFILRCQLTTYKKKKSGMRYSIEMSRKTLSMCLKKLDQLGFIKKETIVKREIEDGDSKSKKFSSMTYITVYKKLQARPITFRTAEELISKRFEK